MSGWGVFALVVVGLPVVVLIRWFVADRLRARRRARYIARFKPDWSVDVIRNRVEQERAEERLTRANTEVLPVISPDDVPTKVIPVLPSRKRPYVDRPPTPWPRKPLLNRPDPELMQRVLYGLHKLPDKPPNPEACWPGAEPDA